MVFAAQRIAHCQCVYVLNHARNVGLRNLSALEELRAGKHVCVHKHAMALAHGRRECRKLPRIRECDVGMRGWVLGST